MSFSPEAQRCWSRRSLIRLTAGSVLNAVRGEELRRVNPPGDKALDPGLLKLLSRLREIIAGRKHLELEALMAPTFRVEFDIGKGPAAFRLHWRPESAASPVWGILERLIALPGHFYMDTLYAVPYVFSSFPFDLDPLRYVVAVRDGVNLLSQPKTDAARVGAVSYSIVPLAQRLEPPVVIPAGSFVELNHPEIGHCFAASSDVYSPAAHRAFFEKRDGLWCWISLAAATQKDPPDLHLHKPPGG